MKKGLFLMMLLLLSLALLAGCDELYDIITDGNIPSVNADVPAPPLYPESSPGNGSSASVLQAVTVSRVIDGDTIVICTGDRVRLIGVDAPEMGFSGGVYEYGATAATEFVRELIDGQMVWLEPDGNDTDRFDRLRRYVWLIDPADTTCENLIRSYMLNALLLHYGHAEVAIFGTVRNEALFRRIEAGN